MYVYWSWTKQPFASNIQFQFKFCNEHWVLCTCHLQCARSIVLYKIVLRVFFVHLFLLFAKVRWNLFYFLLSIFGIYWKITNKKNQCKNSTIIRMVNLCVNIQFIVCFTSFHAHQHFFRRTVRANLWWNIIICLTLRCKMHDFSIDFYELRLNSWEMVLNNVKHFVKIWNK